MAPCADARRGELPRRRSDDAGVDLFEKLGLHRTESRNGVLVYAAVHERRFTIIGDMALDAGLRDELFGEALRRLSIAFRRGAFGEGLAAR